MKKKMIKKIIAFCLSIAICLESIMPAVVFAKDSNSVNENGYYSEISEITDGFMYLLKTENKIVTILVNEHSYLVTGSISFTEGEIYEFIFENFSYVEFEPQSQSFWDFIVQYMENNLEQGKFLEFEIVKESTDITNMRSSVANDLMSELEDLVGDERPEFARETTTISGKTITTTEQQANRIELVDTFSWNETLTVASFITGILGLVTKTKTVATICGIFGLVVSAESLIPKGSGQRYRCYALIKKYTYVEGISTPCNRTLKYINYYGFDDGNLASVAPAKIYTDEPVINYSDNESFFYDYTQQAEEAYKYYEYYYT